MKAIDSRLNLSKHQLAMNLGKNVSRGGQAMKLHKTYKIANRNENYDATSKLSSSYNSKSLNSSHLAIGGISQPNEVQLRIRKFKAHRN